MKNTKKTREHVFQLRPEFQFKVELPEDMTPKEVERLCKFISVLSLEVPEDGDGDG